MEHSTGLRSPVLTYGQCFVLSLQSYIKNGKNMQLPRQGVCSGTESCAFLGTTCSFPPSLPSSHSQIQTTSLSRQNARGCFAPLWDCGEEAVCTSAVAEYKYFPWVKWLLPKPSIWQWCPKCGKVVMLLSPKAFKSWVFQWGKSEPVWTSLEERQMRALPQNLIWAACEFQGALWLYFTSLAFILLLLHTPHRLCEVLHGKETWFRRGGGHALGTPGLVEPFGRGRSAQALWRSMHRPWGRATAVPPAPLWKIGCRSNGCYGLDAEIAVPDSLDCAMREIKLDDFFWP